MQMEHKHEPDSWIIHPAALGILWNHKTSCNFFFFSPQELPVCGQLNVEQNNVDFDFEDILFWYFLGIRSFDYPFSNQIFISTSISFGTAYEKQNWEKNTMHKLLSTQLPFWSFISLSSHHFKFREFKGEKTKISSKNWIHINLDIKTTSSHPSLLKMRLQILHCIRDPHIIFQFSLTQFSVWGFFSAFLSSLTETCHTS